MPDLVTIVGTWHLELGARNATGDIFPKIPNVEIK
jgi:hypothetical protein